MRLSCALHGADGGPTVVLVPGPTDSWRSYEPVLEHLPQHLRVVAMSPRGHGDSEDPGEGYEVEGLATDVIAVLDALGIDRAERVAGLVLEAAPLTLRGNEGLEAFVASALAELAAFVAQVA